MECQLDKVTLYYEVVGTGQPILLLHGAPVDHRALMGCMEPIFAQRPGWRRIYPDLPGMGKTQEGTWIASADQMLQVILQFIDRVMPDQSFTLVGHSYAGYLARGLIYHRPQVIEGLCLLVPWIKYAHQDRLTPEKTTLSADPILLSHLDTTEAEGFAFGAVVQNQANWERYQREWLPGLLAHNPQFFDQLLEHPAFSFAVDAPTAPFVKPALILAGKQDHVSGYRQQVDILENYPRATLAVLDRAGHRLQIEQAALFNALVNEWLDRVEENINPTMTAR